MIDLKFNVTNEGIITRTDLTPVVSDAIGEYSATFTFGNAWTGAKTALFKNGAVEASAVLVADSCTIPYTVLADCGDVQVSCFCGDLKTASKSLIPLIPSGYFVATPPAPADQTQTAIYTYTDATGVRMFRYYNNTTLQWYNGTIWIDVSAGGTYMATDASNSNVDKLTFDLTPSSDALAEGQMRWNNTDGTVDLAHNGAVQQIGQELFIKVINKTLSTIPNGSAVYFNGRQGNRPKIELARGDSESTSMVMGLTTQDIASDAEGFITTFGYIRQIKTDYATWAEGQPLYVSTTTAGALTNVVPSAPNHSDIVGCVGIVGGTGIGSIFVLINRHKTMQELADVNGTPLTTSGQIPVWNQTSGYFDFTDNINNKLAKTTNITAIDDTGIADGEIMVANLTGKKIETSNVNISEVVKTTPIATYTHSGNKSVAIAQNADVDVANNKFIKTAHGLVNGNVVFIIPNNNIENIYPPFYYPTPVTINSAGYTVTKINDNEFSLNTITLVANANLDVSKWHFETNATPSVTISGLSASRYRLLMKGQILRNGNTGYIIPNGLSTTDAHWATNGLTTYQIPFIGLTGADIYVNLETIIDYTNMLTIKHKGLMTYSNNTTALISTMIDRILVNPRLRAGTITSIVINTYLANGTTVEVYNA